MNSIHKVITIIYITGILILPILVGYGLYGAYHLKPIALPSVEQLPTFDVNSYTSIWEKISNRKVSGSSPAASFDPGRFPYGRPDPFSP